jgi:two-component system, LuxR family, sensor kinase FixL
LQQSEVRYRELIENASDIIYRIDTRGYFTYMNSVITPVLGYAERDMVGKVYLDLIRPDYRTKARAFYTKQLREQLRATYLEFPAVSATGEEVWLGQNVQLVFEDGQLVGCQAVARDITERKRIEEAMLKQAEELSSANADLEQFAFIAAHDLQEPLRKIQSFGDRLNLKYKDALDEQGRDYLERMRGSATRMRTLIDDLLSFARANKQQRRSFTSLETILKSVLADLQMRLEETNATVSVGVLPTLEVDPSQMRQVFQNLLSNALKFHQADVAPVVSVNAQRLPTGDWEIRVSDNGIGFEEQYHDRIFAVFQRLHSRDKYEGTGIGLAIVRRIVEGHGGQIEVSSRPNHGTTFAITMPGVAKAQTEDSQEAVLA